MRKRLPVYIEMKAIARVLEWPTWKARRWCIREHAAVKRGGHWVATPDRLRQAFPELWERMVELQMIEAEAARARRKREALESALARARGAP